MKVELTKEECQYAVVALITMAKAPEINTSIMKVLLALSDKLMWKETEQKEVSKEPKTGKG